MLLTTCDFCAELRSEIQTSGQTAGATMTLSNVVNSQSRTTSSKRDDFEVLGTAKLSHRNSISWPTTRGGNVSKRIMMEFTIVSQRDPENRDSQLEVGWTEEKCIEMDKLAQENHSYGPSSEEYERYKKNWCISLNKSGRNAPMKLRADFREAVTIMNRLHRESGEERPEPIPYYNTKGGIRLLLPVPHGGSGMKTGGAHFFLKKKNCL